MTALTPSHTNSAASNAALEGDSVALVTPQDALSIHDNPKDVLQKMLNVNFIMTKASLLVEQYHKALRTRIKREQQSSLFNHSNNDNPKALYPRALRAIGWGSCGKVYHQLGTSHIIKKAINGNIVLAENCRLWNELLMHKRIEEAIEAIVELDVTPRVHVPRLHRYISADDAWWTAHKEWFPGEDTPENILIAEHIPLCM